MKKETTSKRLKQIMADRNLKQVDILRKCAPICEKYNVRLGKNDLSQYVSGKVEPGSDKLGILGRALNVSEAWLMGYDVPMARDNTTAPKKDFDIFSIPGILPLPKMVQKPLIGTIACGTPILAEQNIDSYIPVPDDIRCDFALRCEGDSMIGAHIMPGASVYIREQPDVENGEIAAVIIEDERATLKRVYKTDNAVTLMAENSSYAPIIITGEQLQHMRILGRVVAYTNYLL
jgi:repressor LexA